MNLQELTLKHLQKHPLYKSQHTVRAREIPNGWWIGYRTTPSNLTIRTTHFDVNITQKTFFVLHIEIEGKYRGKGYGDALYKTLEHIAEEAGCEKIQMMPSGWTPSGETRESYLLRRGYKKFGEEVVKEFVKQSIMKGELQ